MKRTPQNSWNCEKDKRRPKKQAKVSIARETWQPSDKGNSPWGNRPLWKVLGLRNFWVMLPCSLQRVHRYRQGVQGEREDVLGRRKQRSSPRGSHDQSLRRPSVLATLVWNCHPKRTLASNHPVPRWKGQEFHFVPCRMRKNALTKPSWLRILKEIAKGLSHIHRRGILHNDLKANNVVLEKRNDYNPVIIDFGKSRFTSDPKQVMSLSVSCQAAYRKRYPHIAPEIVCGKGT